MFKLLIFVVIPTVCNALFWLFPSILKKPPFPVWDTLRVTYGQNIFSPYAYPDQPLLECTARAERYRMISDGCNLESSERIPKYLGRRFIKNGDPSLVLIYDVNGFIAGMQFGIPAHQLPGGGHGLGVDETTFERPRRQAGNDFPPLVTFPADSSGEVINTQENSLPSTPFPDSNGEVIITQENLPSTPFPDSNPEVIITQENSLPSTPFPDSNGEVIITQQNLPSTPFPDSNPEVIITQENSLPSTPFPDSNGEVIITQENLPSTPFPDSNGEVIITQENLLPSTPIPDSNGEVIITQENLPSTPIPDSNGEVIITQENLPSTPFPDSNGEVIITQENSLPSTPSPDSNGEVHITDANSLPSTPSPDSHGEVHITQATSPPSTPPMHQSSTMRSTTTRNPIISVPEPENYRDKRPIHHTFSRDRIKLQSGAEMDYLFLTIYFVPPAKVCEGRTIEEFEHSRTGEGLYIQNGTKFHSFYEISQNEGNLDHEHWRKGRCIPFIGQQYHYQFRSNAPCDEIFPLGLVYNDGKLTGFHMRLKADLTSTHWNHPSKMLLKIFHKNPPNCHYDVGRISQMDIFLKNSFLTNICP